MESKNFKEMTFFFVITICSLTLYSQTIIPDGPVSGTWTLEKSPYHITGNIEIPNDSTLIVEPGVLIEFQGHFELNVKGVLLAEGTKADTIYFSISDTSGFQNPDSVIGGWKGIRIIDPDITNDTTKLSYCKLEFAKAVGSVWHINAGGALTVINFDNVLVSNSLFCNNSAGGDSSEAPSGGAIHLAWSDIKIDSCTFINNRALSGGAIQVHESNPLFTNNNFINNYAKDGGGISFSGLSNPYFYNNIFDGNKALNNGGGVMCNDLDATFENVIFKNNSANWGGGIGAVNCKIFIDDCKFTSNSSIWLGGGIASDYCTIELQNSVLDSNSSDDACGAIHAYHTTLEAMASNFIYNIANYGGAIHSDFSTIDLNSCDFSNNSALNGGAIHSWMCNVIVDECNFLQNSVISEGGAIEFNIDTTQFTNNYKFNLTNTNFVQNSADFRSGAIRIEQYNSESSITDLIIDRCEFEENHAERNGAIRIFGNISDIIISNSIFNKNYVDMFSGAISASGYITGIVYNCLFTNNKSVGNPAAFGITHGANIDFINNTFANNHGGNGAVFSLRRGGHATLTNCILWGNKDNAILMTSVTDSTPCSIEINYSDIQNGIDSIHYNDTISSILWGDGNIFDDPLFTDTLLNNFKLSDSSPSIGSGIQSIKINGKVISSPSEDIMGVQRPSPENTNPDMGAYENTLGIPTFVSTQGETTPTSFELQQNYPNPFNPATKIRYNIPVAALSLTAGTAGIIEVPNVTLKVYDILGREITTLVNEKQNPGNYEVKFNVHSGEFRSGKGQSLSSGIYLYRLQVNPAIGGAGEFIETKKMILMR